MNKYGTVCCRRGNLYADVFIYRYACTRKKGIIQLDIYYIYKQVEHIFHNSNTDLSQSHFKLKERGRSIFIPTAEFLFNYQVETQN